MMVHIDLKQFIREYEAKNRTDITWSDIRERTGLAQTTINRLINGKSQQVSLEVIQKLCNFFDLPDGPVPFIVYKSEQYNN